MTAPLFATLGVVGAATCSSSLCIWTFQYFAENVEQLISGLVGFVRVCSWGWLVQFCVDTFQLSDGSHSPVPSFNLVMTYFNFFILAVYLHREARRLNLTFSLALATLIGTIFCLGTFIPGLWLVRRALALRGAGPSIDKHPLDLGRSGRWIPVLSILCAIGCGALWMAGTMGGSEVVYGIGLSLVRLALPIGYAVVVWRDDAPSEIYPPRLFRAWLIFCKVAVCWAYVVATVACLDLEADMWVGYSTWATRIFQADLFVLRLTRVAILAEHGSYWLAALELVAGPIGFIMWLWNRSYVEGAAEEHEA